MREFLRGLVRAWPGLVVVGVIALAAGFGGGFALARLGEEEEEGAGSGVECPAPESTSAAGEPLPSAAVEVPLRFAPLVFLHPRERFRPMSAECFLLHSELRWSRKPQSQLLAARGGIDALGLGRGEYRVLSRGGTCGQDECEFTSRDFTRPYDTRRPGALGGRGFFLDVQDAARRGARSGSEGAIFTGTPAYYEFVEGRVITYWFFYGFSAPGALAIPGGIDAVAHEGDWERISVHLDASNAPIEVAYYAHGGQPRVIAWSTVPKLGTHPAVFSAQGSHASYPRAGVFEDNLDVTRVGFLWPTWDSLIDGRGRPWYGFGGAWGVAREEAELAGPLVPPSDLTGPLGPSPYKRPAPCAWADECP